MKSPFLSAVLTGDEFASDCFHRQAARNHGRSKHRLGPAQLAVRMIPSLDSALVPIRDARGRLFCPVGNTFGGPVLSPINVAIKQVLSILTIFVACHAVRLFKQRRRNSQFIIVIQQHYSSVII